MIAKQHGGRTVQGTPASSTVGIFGEKLESDV